MYRIVYISSGIVAVSFLSKGNALQWLIANNYDEEGNELNMYKLVRETDNEQ